MRRLTLILSDLYMPEEAAGNAALSSAIELPNFDWLLRFADPPQHIRDWRSWLADEMALPELARLPVAQACARYLLQHDASAWLATPVHLEARLDHVRLVDRGMLRVAAAERAAWCAEFAQAFAPQYSLHDAGERGFLLTGIAPTIVQSHDPARLLDADISASLPRGPEAAELRRLGAEIEMWLHRAALNARRERAGERRISALWLWGGGLDEPSDSPANRNANAALPRDAHLHGGDPFLPAAARAVAAAGGRELRWAAAPESFAEMDVSAAHAVVELTPMTGPARESLASMEAHWFAAVRAAMKGGLLTACDVIANDRWFHIGSRAHRKFWRRRASWLRRLGSEARVAKA